MSTHDFFDRQTAMDIEGIDTDVLNVLSTEAELIKQELEAYRIEVAQLKQRQEELWQDEQMAEYELTSVFIHRGSSPSFGHYFFYARCLPDRPDEWFKYNDSDVSLVSRDEVLADTTGSTANPYLVSSRVLPLFVMLIIFSARFRAKRFWSRAYCQPKCHRLGEYKMKLYLTSCTVTCYCILPDCERTDYGPGADVWLSCFDYSWTLFHPRYYNFSEIDGN